MCLIMGHCKSAGSRSEFDGCRRLVGQGNLRRFIIVPLSQSQFCETSIRPQIAICLHCHGELDESLLTHRRQGDLKNNAEVSLRIGHDRQRLEQDGKQSGPAAAFSVGPDPGPVPGPIDCRLRCAQVAHAIVICSDALGLLLDGRSYASRQALLERCFTAYEQKRVKPLPV
jgi:hypothetical protein